MFCFRYTFCVCKHKNTILSYRMGQKFHISQGSVATQLRCLVITLLQIFHRMRQWKKFWDSVNIWQRYGQNFVAYFLGHPVYARALNILWSYSLFSRIAIGLIKDALKDAMQGNIASGRTVINDNRSSRWRQNLSDLIQQSAQTSGLGWQRIACLTIVEFKYLSIATRKDTPGEARLYDGGGACWS